MKQSTTDRLMALAAVFLFGGAMAAACIILINTVTGCFK